MWKRISVLGLFAMMGASAIFVIIAQRRPDNLGVTNGRLAPCPSTPNCVSTQADPNDREHYIAPLSYEGSVDDALHRAKLALAELPRTTLMEQSGPYLLAESRTESGIFADDVEILIDEATSTVHFRSAARIGRSDLGVNRKRMDAFRAAWVTQE